MSEANASFHLFKPSGKWGYSGRGYASEHVWKKFTHVDQRAQILHDNNGQMPGINGTGEFYRIIVVLDEHVPYGWPLCINPVNF